MDRSVSGLVHGPGVSVFGSPAPFGTLVFRGISDNPNPALKRLTISFLALKGKGLLVPCIRRQRFTRILTAPKRISCHLELGNLNFHVPIMCKPM